MNINLSHILDSLVAKEQVQTSVSTGSITDSIPVLLSHTNTSASHFLPLWEQQWRFTGRVEVHPPTCTSTAFPPHWLPARPQRRLCPVAGSGNGPWVLPLAWGLLEQDGWALAGPRTSPWLQLYAHHPTPWVTLEGKCAPLHGPCVPWCGHSCACIHIRAASVPVTPWFSMAHPGQRRNLKWRSLRLFLSVHLPWKFCRKSTSFCELFQFFTNSHFQLITSQSTLLRASRKQAQLCITNTLSHYFCILTDHRNSPFHCYNLHRQTMQKS